MSTPVPPLFIGPYEIGQQTNLKPFMLPDKAFETLTNAYVFRGRVQRKTGHDSLGRLRRVITSAAAGNISSPGAGTVVFNIFTALGITGEPNAQVELDTITNIVIVIGAPISQTLTASSGNGGFFVAPPGVITAASINYATGDVAVAFSGAAAASAMTVSMAYYPMLPVMGLPIRDLIAINVEETIAFDTKYAYHFTANQWVELPSATPTTWTGSDSDFFWTTNYWRDSVDQNIFWATNFSGPSGDPIRIYSGSPLTWSNFIPFIRSDGTSLQQSLMLIPFKGRLVALNTYEGTTLAGATNFRQRARWSQNGDPTVIGSTGPYVPGAWSDDVVGKGGFVDASTGEEIISAAFVKDQLIVYFERSTWQLLYNGNELLPFIWQRIDSELGAESTFSNVRFDNGLICFGNVGIHACNGQSTQRIDEEIPDTIFGVQGENRGPERVYGIRDYYKELVYFAYPDKPTQPYANFKFPNRMLVYSYRGDTWSFFDDHWTAFGYFQGTPTITWGTITDQWLSWDEPWQSPVDDLTFPFVIAGNQQGFIARFTPDDISNSATLAIRNIQLNTPLAGHVQFTVPDHNLSVGTYVVVQGALGLTSFNGNVYQIYQVIDSNNFVIVATGTGVYAGTGLIKVLNNIEITTKMFTPFWEYGRRYRLKKIRYLFERTEVGEVTSNIFINTDDTVTMTAVPDGVIPGTNIISTFPEPDINFQQNQDFIWHTQYPVVEGETFQVQLVFAPFEMMNLPVCQSPLSLHGMIFYFEVAGEFQ